MSDTQRHPCFPVHNVTRPANRQARATSAALLTAAGALLTLERQRHEAFVSTLAHELRQPLSALLNAVEILRLGQAPAGFGGAVEIIQRQALHMTAWSRMYSKPPDRHAERRCCRDNLWTCGS